MITLDDALIKTIHAHYKPEAYTSQLYCQVGRQLYADAISRDFVAKGECGRMNIFSAGSWDKYPFSPFAVTQCGCRRPNCVLFCGDIVIEGDKLC